MYSSCVCAAQVESWAFALDAKGLEVLANAGVFYLRTCKLCDDGIVVRASACALAYCLPFAFACKSRTPVLLLKWSGHVQSQHIWSMTQLSTRFSAGVQPWSKTGAQLTSVTCKTWLE